MNYPTYTGDPVASTDYGDDPIFDYTENATFDSSAIEQAWYNHKNRALIVEFVEGGLAGYRDVNLDTWNAFKNATSAGRFYVYSIKSIFPGFSTPNDLTFEYDARNDPNPKLELVEADAPTRSWKVSGYVTAIVDLEVTGDTLEDALRNFADTVRKHMGENQVSIDYRSVTEE